MMEPHWRKISTNKKVRCEEGDPLMRIIDAILQQVTILAEGLINQVIGMIDGILQSIGGWFGIPRLPRVCFPVASQPGRCDGGGLTREEANALAACYDESRGMQDLCYFERVRRICSDASLYEGYQSLFDIGYESVDDLKNQYAEAFGDTFNVIDPTLDALFSAVAVSEQTRNLDIQKGICDSQAFVNAMTLDMVIVSCVFALLQGFCGTDDTNDLDAFLSSIEWKLPTVRFDWSVGPPPPPPALASVYTAILREDPEVKRYH